MGVVAVPVAVVVVVVFAPVAGTGVVALDACTTVMGGSDSDLGGGFVGFVAVADGGNDPRLGFCKSAAELGEATGLAVGEGLLVCPNDRRVTAKKTVIAQATL